MASRRPSPVPSRRTVAIKRADGEPLTRADIQFDVLWYIMQDKHCVFSDPYPTPDTEAPKLSFRDLYIKTLLRSPKVTKILKDKMTELSSFAEDFSMLALLVNVGRINTTMSFFSEMKTAIRTYHPIPAFQRTSGNLQDAPRIKHILKTSLLDDELKAAPTTPVDILTRVNDGHIPPTSVMNLLFVMSNHSGAIGQAHLPLKVDFHDLFMKRDISSASRGRAFLWLCFNYLEHSSAPEDTNEGGYRVTNPFADVGQVRSFTLETLGPEDESKENVDPDDELALAIKLVSQRNTIVNSQSAKEPHKLSLGLSSGAQDDDDQMMDGGDEIKGKGKAISGKMQKPKPQRPATHPDKDKDKKTAVDRVCREKSEHKGKVKGSFAAESESLSDEDINPAIHNFTHRIIVPPSDQHDRYNSMPYNSQTHLQPRNRNHISGSPETSSRSNRYRHSPYKRVKPVLAPAFMRMKEASDYYHHAPYSPPRTMLQQAWHVVNATDPLVDSDEEERDEHTREDYFQRLRIISRLRGKPPTPEPISQESFALAADQP